MKSCAKRAESEAVSISVNNKAPASVKLVIRVRKQGQQQGVLLYLSTIIRSSISKKSISFYCGDYVFLKS
jgi:hypothetical protein